jgi:uncharacterized protein YggE
MTPLARLTPVVLFAVSAAGPSALAQVANESPRIATTGVGEVSLAPDWATLAIDITAEDSSAAGAANTSAAATRRVVAAMAALGLAGDSVVRVSFSVGPRYDYQEQRVRGYSGRGTVRIEVKELDQLGRIIDTALAVGATGISGLRFHSNREEAARADALRQAVAQARADAQVLALAAGGQLGRPLEIRTDREVRPSFGFAELAAYARSGAAEAPELTPQDVVVMVVVETRWELVPGRQ